MVLTAPAQAADLFDRPVSASALDRVRGGFSSADGGVVLSFSVQQSVFVNGTLAATSGLQLSQGGSTVSGEGSGGALVQIGGGNGVVLGAAGLLPASIVVQNSLDNQKIQTVTQIDVAATILRAYRDLHLQSTLNSAITNSLRR